MALTREFDDVVQSIDVDVPAEFGLGFSDRRKDGRHVVDCVDVVLLHHALQALLLRDVQVFEWA